MKHGGGGFNHQDCYSMPSTTRRLFVKRLSKDIEETNKAIKEAKGGANNMSMDQMATGDVSKFLEGKAPTTITKANPPAKR